jgi:hypothetical protein
MTLACTLSLFACIYVHTHAHNTDKRPHTFIHLACTLFPQLCLHQVKASSPSHISSWHMAHKSPSSTGFCSTESLSPVLAGALRRSCWIGLNLYDMHVGMHIGGWYDVVCFQVSVYVCRVLVNLARCSIYICSCARA